MSRHVVEREDFDTRLDIFVTQELSELSRSSVQKLCEQGKIMVNNELQKPRYKLRTGDVVEIDFDTKSKPAIADLDIPIIYEDDDCIVIDKPLGVLTHSKGAFNPEPTVATFVQQHSKDVTGERSGIAHRLDRATSGVMICAKTPEALSWLQKQFSTRKVKKTYQAIIEGTLDPRHAIIDMPIERNPKKPQTFRVGVNGKTAQTEYMVLTKNDTYNLVELKPTTGRTHQLRVHLANLKHPIVGDTLYDGASAKRLYLHARKLELTLPSRQRMTFESELPAEFMELTG